MMVNVSDPETEVQSKLLELDKIERLLQAAIRRELLRHKALGNSIAVSRGGRVVIVPAEEIEVGPE